MPFRPGSQAFDSVELLMTYTVLIVDDAEINLILFEALVKRIGGCLPVKHADARQGLGWALNHEFDLLIVDYMMPDLNGVDFIKQLRLCEGKEDIPILMITANDRKRAPRTS